jgi:ubiquitin-protein ligase
VKYLKQEEQMYKIDSTAEQNKSNAINTMKETPKVFLIMLGENISSKIKRKVKTKLEENQEEYNQEIADIWQEYTNQAKKISTSDRPEYRKKIKQLTSRFEVATSGALIRLSKKNTELVETLH